MNCLKCNSEIGESDKHCSQCGADLTNRCPFCREVMSTGFMIGDKSFIVFTVGPEDGEKGYFSEAWGRIASDEPMNCITLSRKPEKRNLRTLITREARGSRCDKCKRIIIPYDVDSDPIIDELGDGFSAQLNCPKCNNSINSDAKFCETCGADLNQTPPKLE